jgi:predicted ferric reductase
MKKKNVLQLVSFILFSIALVLLILAMIFHAVFDEKAWISVVLSVICACIAFVGCVIMIYSVKGKGDSDENKNER